MRNLSRAGRKAPSHFSAVLLEEDSLLLPVLREKGWAATEGDRLFVQLNQSTLVSEFVSFVLDLAQPPKRS
ncbi:MAG: hypothetical protein M3O15_10085 [Acidobacteriota bacterium]|nr:hypothetical protein [Acidobacteriota bacterium]